MNRVPRYERHDDCHSKCGLRLLTVSDQARLDWWSAALGDVPGCTRLWVGWVTHVRPGLIVDRDCPDGDKSAVGKHRKYWVEYTAYCHDDFAQKDKHGQDCDDHIEVCCTV